MFHEFRRFFIALVALLALSGLYARAARASVEARIDLTHQRMSVYVDGRPYASWPVSTARRGYVTPRGTFRPRLLKRMHYSRKYDDAPMPYSIFFLGGYAIHGTGAISRLGRPASHGCVRLHPANAATLFSLIKRHGLRNTRIRIFGAPRFASRRGPARRKWSSRKRRYGHGVATRRRRGRQHHLTRRIRRRYLDLPVIIYGGIADGYEAFYR